MIPCIPSSDLIPTQRTCRKTKTRDDVLASMIRRAFWVDQAKPTDCSVGFLNEVIRILRKKDPQIDHHRLIYEWYILFGGRSYNQAIIKDFTTGSKTFQIFFLNQILKFNPVKRAKESSRMTRLQITRELITTHFPNWPKVYRTGAAEVRQPKLGTPQSWVNKIVLLYSSRKFPELTECFTSLLMKLDAMFPENRYLRLRKTLLNKLEQRYSENSPTEFSENLPKEDIEHHRLLSEYQINSTNLNCLLEETLFVPRLKRHREEDSSATSRKNSVTSEDLDKFLSF